ncbi:hypothetical protein ASPZODRAFT_20283 [Penicilliopsis zonata CBS 506.65]|uniref:Uncharacterized protein n=1 Tax=Penicilliopsis zonata CBS 506.65 TaxID=1073090 RepID=A0A1L9S6F5_9EURO|nr:hypothetical protein ASPZODRAFT_20283 [Penicilliopsis zonata CBS 506.65]OJJ42756.1 hypothetical protein ASPZODRAFT_20283 [Penicilliopsis zonata CBS 506.65]
MCGPSRPSHGGCIAVIFPLAETSPYPLFFNRDEKTTIMRLGEEASLASCTALHMRIETHGDISQTAEGSPLYCFTLDPRKRQFDLPELELGVSERGIVGRQITLFMDEKEVGRGIIGYN